MSQSTPLMPRTLAAEDDPSLQAEIRHFQRWGYLVIDQAIDPDTVEQARAALADAQARGCGEFTSELLEQDERFVALLDPPPVMRRIRALLGTCVQLHSATARIMPPGTPEQAWHRDGPWPQDPDGVPQGGMPGQINCGFYLDQLTEDNGPIVVLPGSHRSPFAPPQGSVPFPDERRVFATPGQAVIFSGWLFHRGDANRSQAQRRACLMCYQNAWMKSRESFSGPRVARLRAEGSPERRLLLGEQGSW